MAISLQLSALSLFIKVINQLVVPGILYLTHYFTDLLLERTSLSFELEIVAHGNRVSLWTFEVGIPFQLVGVRRGPTERRRVEVRLGLLLVECLSVRRGPVL